MDIFWSHFLRPLAIAVAPSRIMLACGEPGPLGVQLATFCSEHECALDILSTTTTQTDTIASHMQLLPPADLLLWDGDRNWVTAYGMLQASFARAAALNSLPPVVAVHHTGWPWGRRDSYARPETIAADDRHAYAARGIRPGIDMLFDDGWSGHTLNALHEGGPRNGVLTAVEDFVAAWPEPIRSHTIPLFHGLTVLVPQTRATEAVDGAIGGFLTGPGLLEACMVLQERHDTLLSDLAASRLRASQLGEALMRARGRMAGTD